MNISDYAAPLATVAVAVISALAARLTATRQTREVQQLKLLIETTKETAAESPEGKALRAQLLYEVEFYAARNSGRDKGTYFATWAMVVLSLVAFVYFAWLALDSITPESVDYSTSALLSLPAVASAVVAIVYGGRVDRIKKERDARARRDSTLKEISNYEAQVRAMESLGMPKKMIDEWVRKP
ncbi:hypothetical protein [Nocardioides daphniae]|uniref:Uncharacterized protein n=1 Tax=Nocardioides daphniae TaxID=402297 RepID=A0ABQ1Q6B3_9ACTN|nr:hypothetical protein [Nocardioides daphniae]GGD15510.1 hypothetical protein GCM10007231_13150 [Nocardioides daphniae]